MLPQFLDHRQFSYGAGRAATLPQIQYIFGLGQFSQKTFPTHTKSHKKSVNSLVTELF